MKGKPVPKTLKHGWAEFSDNIPIYEKLPEEIRELMMVTFLAGACIPLTHFRTMVRLVVVEQDEAGGKAATNLLIDMEREMQAAVKDKRGL